MDRHILRKFKAPELRVYAIWIKRLRRDNRASCDPAIFNDPRTTVFWDGEQVMGNWFAEAEGLPSVVWDTYFLYGPDAKWTSVPAPLVASAFPVTRFKSDLRKYLREVLKGQGVDR